MLRASANRRGHHRYNHANHRLFADALRGEVRSGTQALIIQTGKAPQRRSDSRKTRELSGSAPRCHGGYDLVCGDIKGCVQVCCARICGSRGSALLRGQHRTNEHDTPAASTMDSVKQCVTSRGFLVQGLSLDAMSLLETVVKDEGTTLEEFVAEGKVGISTNARLRSGRSLSPDSVDHRFGSGRSLSPDSVY